MEITSIRDMVLQKLTPKCSVCGWNEDVIGLVLWNVKGEGNEARLHKSRDKYYLQVLHEVSTGSTDWVVLCANHKAIEMAKRRKGASSPPPLCPDLVIWHSTAEEVDTFGQKHRWLQKETELHNEVLILWEGAIYTEDKKLMARDWQRLVNERPFLPAFPPSIGITRYKVI